MRTGLSFIAVLAAALAVVAVSPAEPGQISSKSADAERVLAEIDAIDMELDRAVEAYNGATVQLETITRNLAANQKRLVTARANLAAAHKRVANRVLALYTSQEPDALAVLLGASSLGDLIERIDSVNRISKDDVRIAEEVTRFRNEVRTRQQRLVQAQAQQRKVVAQRAARRSTIEGQLAERQTLLASIKDEISKLRAAEQARQERLAREARAQLRSAQTQTSDQQQSSPPPSDPTPPTWVVVSAAAVQAVSGPLSFHTISPQRYLDTRFDGGGPFPPQGAIGEFYVFDFGDPEYFAGGFPNEVPAGATARGPEPRSEPGPRHALSLLPRLRWRGSEPARGRSHSPPIKRWGEHPEGLPDAHAPRDGDLGPPAGRRPVCVLTRDAAVDALTTVICAPITRTVRGIRY